MNKPRFPTSKALLGMLLVLVIAGCSPKARQARLLQKAEASFQTGEYDKARIEYMNVLKGDPANPIAIQQIGLIWFEQGAPAQAVPFLRKSIEITPGNTTVRSKLALAFKDLGAFAEARKQAIAILEQVPDNDDAIILLGETVQTKEDIAHTEEQLQKLKAPGRAAVHLALASLSARKGDLASVENEVQSALALEPKLIQAQLYMAAFATSKKDLTRAAAALKAASDLAPTRSPAHIKLAEFKANSGSIEEARTLLKEMIEKTPDYLPAWRSLAQMAFAEKKYDEALALLENVFGRDLSNLEARLLQAQIWLVKGDTKKAIEGLDRLAKTYQSVPLVLYHLARAQLQDANPSQATLTLKQALEANPEYTEAILLLAEVNLRRADGEAVVAAMETLLKRRPNLLKAQLLLAEGYRSLGRLDAAADVFRRQIQSFPEDATAHFTLGMILRAKGDVATARTAFAKAQDLRPDDLAATFQLVELDLRLNDFDAAHGRVRDQIKKMPSSAGAYFLEGKIFAAERDWKSAETALLKALELDVNALSAYEVLVSTYIAGNNLPQAIKSLEDLLVRKPGDERALMTAAFIYEKEKNFSKAREMYEKLLTANPEFVPALNNLAVLYAERFNLPDKAYEIARKARVLQPANPVIADTLGWVLYKRADYQQALALFVECAGKLPENAEVQFHLGMAYYMAGQTEDARVALQRAVNSTAEFRGKEEAKDRLAMLGRGAGGSPALSVGQLESLLKEQPGDLVTKMHLAEAYEKQAEFAKAAAVYQEVLATNPKLLPALLRLAQLDLGPLQSHAKALELARRARDLAPNDRKAIETLGEAAYRTGDYSFAYSLLQEGARQPAAAPGVLHSFAWSAYFLGKVGQARETFRRLLEVAPVSPQSADARSFLKMIALVDEASFPNGAVAEVQELLAANPAYVPAQMARAAIQVQAGDTKAAIGTYTEIVGRLPDFGPAQKQLASLYLEGPINLEKADEMVRKARKALPEDPEVPEILATIAYHRKEFAAAIPLFQESERKRPLGARALYYLGMSQVKLEKLAQGRATLERALSSGLQEPLASDAKRVLAEPGAQ
jgi:tetratricopeptide (TPR) repeat protein